MKLIQFALLIFCISCLPQESTPTSSSLFVSVGDILVSSSVNDTIHQLDKNGQYIRPLWRTTLPSETIGGLAWMGTTNEILISVNGTPDRVEAVSVIDGSVRQLIRDGSISGTITGIAQLPDSKDLLISELTTIERANDFGGRVTVSGVWPSNVTTNVRDIAPRSNGGFVTASSSTGVRLYPDSLSTFAAEASASARPGTSGSYGVTELPDGGFIATWEGGSTDLVSRYDNSLNFIEDIFTNNQSLLVSPRGVAVGPKGTYLVAANTRDYVLELSSDGSIVNLLARGIIDGPDRILVVPDFGI